MRAATTLWPPLWQKLGNDAGGFCSKLLMKEGNGISDMWGILLKGSPSIEGCMMEAQLGSQPTVKGEPLVMN